MKVNVHALAEQDMYLVAMHLPSERRISKAFPKYIEDYHAGQEEIMLVRGYFHNKLHRLNQKARDLATKYGVRVDPSWYLMSERAYRKFRQKLEELKEEYEEYEKALNDFLLHGKTPEINRDDVKFYEDYTEKVKEYLKEKNAEVSPVNIVDGITVNVLPLQLNPATIAKAADDVLREEVQRTVEEIAKKVEEDIKKRLKELEKKLKNVRSVMHLPNVRKAIEEEIENISEICEDYGVELPKDLKYRIERFYEQVKKRATGGITSERLRALVEELTE